MGRYVAESDFERNTTHLTTRITRDGRDGFPVEAGRYRIVVARACPWAHRSIIVRCLVGLESAISMAIAGPAHDEHSWNFSETTSNGRDPVLGIDIAQITLDLSTEWIDHHRPGAPDLYPNERRDEIDELMRMIYEDVNNGVYRCGFAGTQAAYDTAYRKLFARLDALEDSLERRRYLIGESITEADVRLFTTLVRFDSVYHGHFKCNRQKLSEFPALWAYARDLFQKPGFGDTVDFDHIKRHYFCVHTDINPSGIVPAGPDLAVWMTPHERDRLGGAPFGDGSPPGPPPDDEVVPPAHSPLGALQLSVV